MKTSIRAILAAGTALAMVPLAACGTPGSKKKSSDGGNGPVKIAVVDAQSGQLSSLGHWESNGAKLAVDQWNAKGGINGRKIQLDVFDDQGDPTTGTNLARKISSEGYLAMIGTSESAVTTAMAPILQQEKIPNITSGQATSMTKLGSPFLFLNGPTSVTYDETLAKYLVDTLGHKTFALVTNNGAYGKGEHDAFTGALTSRSISPVSDQIVTPDQKDFSAALTTIRQKNPDVVFIGAEEVEAGLIAKQARSLGVRSIFAGAAPLGTPVYRQTAGVPNANGSIVSTPYLSNDTSDAAKTFAAAYKAKFNETAELHGAKAYDGTNILLTALKTSNVATGLKLADAIRATKYAGLLGNFDYNDKGVGITATVIGEITNGALTPVT
jgi:branched-chain amino acid transport system substrate-binding protein